MEQIKEQIPAILSSIFTGIILLLIEYRTRWFSKKIDTLRKRETYSPIVLITFVLLIFLPVILFLSLIIVPLVAVTTSLYLPQTKLDNPQDPNTAVLTISDKNTKTVFDNEIILTINDVLSSSVEVTIGSATFESITTELTIGEVTLFQTENIYEIRLTSIRLLGNRAQFIITKLDDPIGP